MNYPIPKEIRRATSATGGRVSIKGSAVQLRRRFVSTDGLTNSGMTGFRVPIALLDSASGPVLYEL